MTLGLGIIGGGAISRRVAPHFRVPDTAARVRVAAVCDPVPRRADEICAEHPGAQAYLDLDDLLADESVDLVTVASPIGLHFQHGLAAIRAGKHVHFNKTMAVTKVEADLIIAEAAAREVRIVASPGEMLRPHNIRTKELIESGAIGTVCWAACGAAFGEYHLNEPERAEASHGGGIDPSWYFRSPGGGPLYDMTVYALHGLTGVLGSVQRVTALSDIRIATRSFAGRAVTTDAHDNTLILLDFGEGLFALAYGTAAGILTDGAEFDFSGRYYGTEGSIVGLLLNGNPFDYPGREIAVSAPDHGAQPNFGGNEWVLPNVTGEHRALAEAHVFADVMQLVDWVIDDIPSVATAEHARHVIEIIEAAYRAAETGERQELLTQITPDPNEAEPAKQQAGLA